MITAIILFAIGVVFGNDIKAKIRKVYGKIKEAYDNWLNGGKK
jgi:hypothetical protein